MEEVPRRRGRERGGEQMETHSLDAGRDHGHTQHIVPLFSDPHRPHLCAVVVNYYAHQGCTEATAYAYYNQSSMWESPLYEVLLSLLYALRTILPRAHSHSTPRSLTPTPSALASRYNSASPLCPRSTLPCHWRLQCVINSRTPGCQSNLRIQSSMASSSSGT